MTEAYERLKTDIRENRMPPGFQGTEPEIAERMGMSRTPVREALIRLESEGLVELVPRRGARVLPIHVEDMVEIYEVLTALEPEAAAALAARGPSKDELASLEAATADMEAALQSRDLEAWAAADDRFHQALLAAHGNGRMLGIMQSLTDQAHRARLITLRLRAWPAQSTSEHRAILGLLRAGDAGAVRAAFRAHRKRSSDELIDVLRTYKLHNL